MSERDKAFEEAVKIIESQLCKRSAVDHALNTCIAAIRKLQSSAALGRRHRRSAERDK